MTSVTARNPAFRALAVVLPMVLEVELDTDPNTRREDAGAGEVPERIVGCA
jgi:hypothetical protein